MGKRLEDLNLSDEPIRPVAPQDPRETAWYQFARQIDDLLASGDYEWAHDTLTGIQESVEKYCTVTEGQKRAVRNIEEGLNSRRYDGFRRRRWMPR